MTRKKQTQGPKALIKSSLVICVSIALGVWTLNFLVHLMATKEQMIRFGFNPEKIADLAQFTIVFPLLGLAVTIACLTALIAGTCPFVCYPDEEQ